MTYDPNYTRRQRKISPPKYDPVQPPQKDKPKEGPTTGSRTTYPDDQATSKH